MSNFLSGAKNKSEDLLTVTQLTARIRETLESGFSQVAVVGEISNWSQAGSGHAYYSIKDEGALLSCVMWKAQTGRLRFRPTEGTKVECRGRLSLFDKRGQYQMIVDSMTEAGKGELWQRYEDLKAKLAAEGLFDQKRKRSLPIYPRTVGIVTSPTGAAVRDMLSVLRRRAPSVSVLIWPCRVQGVGAGADIAEGVRKLSQSGRCDVLIVGRGGGSFEDLFEFNDESLARAIAASPIPVVSAVGHEIDFSISDFVADLRAPTPSAGAELVSAGYMDLRERVITAVKRCQRDAEMKYRELRQRTQSALNSHALRQPELQLREMQQRVDLALRTLPRLVDRRLEQARARVDRLAGSLDGHNPDLILKKGYAIVRRTRDDKVLINAEDLKRNLAVELQMQDGRRRAFVTDDAADDLFS